ncbi:MAG: hypothetical protein ACTHN5_20200 [Phycisphaerae bacterium]
MRRFYQLSPGRQALVLFFAFLAFYYVHPQPIIQVDVIAAPYVAWSLVRHLNFDTAAYADVQSHVHAVLMYTMADGARISLFPPGSAIAAVPVVAPVAMLRAAPLGFKGMMDLGKLAAALYAAGSVGVTYLLALRVAPRGALLAAILLGAGSVLYSTGAQALWMHAPAAFFLTLAMYLLYRLLETVTPREQVVFSLVAGVCMGMAIMTRPTSLLFAAAAFGMLLMARKVRATVLYSVAAAVPFGLFLLYNQIHFQHAFSGGYGAGNDTFLWSTPLLHGLAGLTISPNRGLFVYTPAFVLAIPALYFVFRKSTPRATALFLATFLAASVATLLLYSKWWAWYGGWCYGPRYLCEICPTLALLVAVTVANVSPGLVRGLALPLVALSITIQVIGVFGDTNQWSRRHNIGGTTPVANASMDRAMFDPMDSQIVASLRHILRMDAVNR